MIYVYHSSEYHSHNSHTELQKNTTNKVTDTSNISHTQMNYLNSITQDMNPSLYIFGQPHTEQGIILWCYKIDMLLDSLNNSHIFSNCILSKFQWLRMSNSLMDTTVSISDSGRIQSHMQYTETDSHNYHKAIHNVNKPFAADWCSDPHNSSTRFLKCMSHCTDSSHLHRICISTQKHISNSVECLSNIVHIFQRFNQDRRWRGTSHRYFAMDLNSQKHNSSRFYSMSMYSKDRNILYISKCYHQHKCQVDTPLYNCFPRDMFDCQLHCSSSN